MNKKKKHLPIRGTFISDVTENRRIFFTSVIITVTCGRKSHESLLQNELQQNAWPPFTPNLP